MQPSEQASPLSPAELIGCLDVLAERAHNQISEGRQILAQIGELRTQVLAYSATIAVAAAREEAPPKWKRPRAGRNRDFSFAGMAR